MSGAYECIYECAVENGVNIDEVNNVMRKQVGGVHYKRNIQPWEIIDEYNLNFYEGNALKYLLRRKDNRLQDLEKAKHYIEKLIVNEKQKENK